MVKKETLSSANSSIMTQHSCKKSSTMLWLNCKTARLWNNIAVRRPWGQAVLGPDASLARQLSSPISCADAARCLWWFIFSFSALTWETQSSVLGGKGMCALQARGELTYIDKSPHPWFLISLSSCNQELQILTVWLVPKALQWFVRKDPLCSVSEDVSGI